jgi:hypothetical protein
VDVETKADAVPLSGSFYYFACVIMVLLLVETAAATTVASGLFCYCFAVATVTVADAASAKDCITKGTLTESLFLMAFFFYFAELFVLFPAALFSFSPDRKHLFHNIHCLLKSNGSFFCLFS